MPPPEDDDEFAKKVFGESPSVEDAYRKHATRLRHLAEKKFNIPPLDAAGVVNEVFMSYLLRRDSIRDARQWLVGAVCHASRAYWRAAARTSPLPSDVGDYEHPDSPGLEGRIVNRVTMASALNQVGYKCRETLRLYYAEGYSAAEIAAQFGTTSGYVMQLLHTCRKQVRKAYDDLVKDKKE